MVLQNGKQRDLLAIKSDAEFTVASYLAKRTE
jgi:hypothetical protein